MDGELEGSDVRRWKGIAFGVEEKVERCWSQRRSLGLFIFRFLSIFNLCFVCLYDVYTLSSAVRIPLIFPLTPDIPAINIPVLARYSPPTLIDAPTHTLTHTHTLSSDAFFSVYVAYLVWHRPCATYAIYAFAFSVPRQKSFVCALLGLLINRALTAEPKATLYVYTTDRTGTEECTWVHGPGRHTESSAPHGGNE